ncbi:MAG: nucleotidyltransferase family protein [Acidobacteriota bacterium]|nr:nucleotidyltransferase family protein [Acidobacteriota bacterium]
MAVPEAVTAVVLAAGTSSRFADGAKQLAKIAAQSVVRRVTYAVVQSACAETVVVTGHEAATVLGEVAALGVRTVHNPDYASGQSGSVRVGLAAVSPASGGAMFVPCDQPFLDTRTLDAIVETWRREGGITVPCHHGRRGAPVLFPRSLFAELAEIEGDEGGRQILARYADDVVGVELPDLAPLEDFDTVEMLAALVERHGEHR